MKQSNKRNGKYLVRMAVLLIPFLLFACREKGKGTAIPVVDTAAVELLAQSPSHTVLSAQETVRFGETAVSDSGVLYGYIIPDARRTNIISSRVNGRIEKLYVRFPYEYVERGQKLYDIYSAELITAISEYLFLRRLDSTSELTVQGRKRILLSGVHESQLEQYVRNGHAPQVISIYSSYRGYVLPMDNAGGPVVSGSGNTLPGMNNMSKSIPPANILSATPVLREGSYITAGQALFSINDAGSVIALLSIPSGAAPFFMIDQRVELTSDLLPGKLMNGTVSLIDPVLQTGQKFVSVQIALNNPDGKLKFNSQVHAYKQDAGTTHVLPYSCVYDLGKRKIVWVKSAVVDSVSVFIPRIVVATETAGNQWKILSGLNAGEEIALDAGLMTDRETPIKPEQP